MSWVLVLVFLPDSQLCQNQVMLFSSPLKRSFPYESSRDAHYLQEGTNGARGAPFQESTQIQLTDPDRYNPTTKRLRACDLASTIEEEGFGLCNT